MSRAAPLRVAAAVLVGAALLETGRAVSGLPFSAAALALRIAFAFLALAAAGPARPVRAADGGWKLPPAALGLAAGAIFGAPLAAATGSVALAWLSFAALFAVTLAASAPRGAAARGFAAPVRTGLLAFGAAGATIAAVEVESRFAHEELFAAAEALLLAAVWLVLRTALPRSRSDGASAFARRGPSARPGLLAAILLVAAATGLAAAISRYQASFSDPDPPGFAGVSAARPFRCGTAPPDPEAFGGPEVLEAILDRVAANPAGSAPEEGMLALARSDGRRAAAFHAALLSEAARGEYSRGGDTKYWQYEAALRAYYYPRVRAAFPGLFSPSDERRLAAWFAAINRRALSRGADDAIYALAFRKRPEGPYENQENGAALLSLLEAGGLAAPDLAPENRRYLDREPRGWDARFRNNDDSDGYQSEWITNAYAQSLRTGRRPPERMRRSFEWLLLQAAPDGAPPDYNPAVPPALPATAYLGAILRNDPELLWLAGRSARTFARKGLALPAQPGVERPASFAGRSPDAGSCLLFADSGLPNRVGPLAPDKVVFRDGWRPDDGYLLVNLRFAGWHRYRGTNAIVRVSRGEPLVEERRGAPNPWVPLERRLFRDKRIPRENVNGLLVEADGLAGALARLSGFGGPFAQDPPRFAAVEAFDPGGEIARSRTAITGWRGWTHRRSVLFARGGPIVVLDRADGPANRSAAIVWHAVGRGETTPGRLALGASGSAELLLLPLDPPGGTIRIAARRGERAREVRYEPRRDGGLRLASVFLTGSWRGARVSLRKMGAGQALEIDAPSRRVAFPLQ